MKKCILLLFLIPGISLLCRAQWFPMDPVYTLRSSPNISNNEQIAALDSILVYLRGGGFEELNFYEIQGMHSTLTVLERTAYRYVMAQMIL